MNAAALLTFGRWTAAHGALAESAVAVPPRSGPVRLPHSERLPLLLFSQVAWDGVWQRPQEMARRLARHRPVVFCSPVQVHEAVGPFAGRWREMRSEEGGRLLVFAPLILSGEYRHGAIRAANRVIVARRLGALLGRRSFILLTNSPFVDWLVTDLRPAAVGYDAIDDFCAFEWAPAGSRRREERILRRADFAFAGTDSLARALAGRTRSMEFIASGVDIGKLQTPADEPPELRGLARPRLLYVGTLNDRVSGRLIADTARAFPHASVILVGPRRATFGDWRFPPNVIELGLRPHDDLPGFYQHCDIGLMPFADNKAARAVNPVKTLEYLACGLPVVSTPVPDVRKFYEPPVVVAPAAGWREAIARALSGDGDAARSARREFAAGRSWTAMTDRMESVIAETERRVIDKLGTEAGGGEP